jgi:hypothetical protein
MTIQVANQAAARARRPAVPADLPILASKITAPSVPDWALPRPRVTKLIAQGRRWCRLTAVTAPAGAGKTMALTLCAAAEPGLLPGSAWMSSTAGQQSSGPMSSRHCTGPALPRQWRCPPRRGRQPATSSCYGLRRRWRPRTRR